MIVKKSVLAVSLLLAALGGCTPIATAQRDLATQAQAGVDVLRAAHLERRAALEQAQLSQRKLLDDAFDADVRERAGAATQPALDPQWVITARKAYAVGLDALAAQKAAAEKADAAAEANYRALTEALDEIRALAQSQLTWSAHMKPGSEQATVAP